MKKILPGLLGCLLISLIATSQSFSLGFTGADQYATVDHNALFNVSNALTVEAWINTASGTTRQIIVAKMFPTQDTWLFELQPAGGAVKLNLYMHTGTGSDHLSTSLIAANRWYHVAAVYDGSAVTFYIDGKMDGVVPQTGNLSTNTRPLRIGAWEGTSPDARRFNGFIDEVRLWNVARTAGEIKAGMYGDVATNATGLIAYYKMNEGDGQTIADASVNGLNGVLGVGAGAETNDPSWTDSPVQAAGNSLSFDGINDYLEIPWSATHDMSNSVSMEAWIYPATNNWSNILMKGYYGYGFALSGYGGPGSCGTQGNLLFWDQNGCGPTVRSSLTYSTNAWQHVAVTVEDIGAQLRIYFYLNGVQDGPYFSAIGAISNGGANRPLFIGTQGDCICNFFNGSLDEVRVWNTVRTASEIQTNKNLVLHGSEPGLVAQYSFNQGIAGGANAGLLTAIDASSNNNHAAMLNFALSGNTSNWSSHAMITLPVKLGYFTASQPTPATVVLQWQTSQETNSSAFIVEKSTDGKVFKPIGELAAAGNSETVINYRFSDLSPAKGENYYRLLQKDLDGRVVYSRVVLVVVAGNHHMVLIENPVHNKLQLTVYSNAAGVWNFQIINTSGQIVLTKQVNMQQGNNTILVPAQTLPSGQYFLRAINKGRIETVSFSRQ